MSMYPQSTPRRIELEYGTTDRSLFNFFNAIYAWMAVGLAVTAAVAWGAAQSQTLLQLMFGSRLILVATALGLFVIAMAAQSVALRISAAAGTAMFLLYAALMGVFISYIFVVYRMQTIAAAFLVTGGVFGVMSIYGYITKRNLTSIGSFCLMGLFGLFLASIVNVFVASNGLGWFITYAVVLVTVGIVAYETQNLKKLAMHFEGNPDMLARISIIGALVLYISFINLFISVLRILGSRR